MSEVCKTCGAAIHWAYTPNGKKAPIDLDPVSDGNVLLLKPTGLMKAPLAVVLSGEILEEAKDSRNVHLRKNHWATCPDRAEWREKTDAKETCKALLEGDLVEAIDGMCDVLCVVYGTAVEMGVDLSKFWDAVHASNMEKRGGPTRTDGKKLKPLGWTAPDIAGVLSREYGIEV